MLSLHIPHLVSFIAFCLKVSEQEQLKLAKQSSRTEIMKERRTKEVFMWEGKNLRIHL